MYVRNIQQSLDYLKDCLEKYVVCEFTPRKEVQEPLPRGNGVEELSANQDSGRQRLFEVWTICPREINNVQHKTYLTQVF